MSKCPECRQNICADWCGKDPSEMQDVVDELESTVAEKDAKIARLSKISEQVISNIEANLKIFKKAALDIQKQLE